ncbi:conserved hypothetical protein [Flavobacterium sp. 9AF]|uniref:DUF4421 family protein n=1 Tax=Flavobacterium sp. 9AF TaxID=2653142 RepID=UPI0012EF6B01|nr:DUF4421 family protein [Flavobacterium sp. 9AF]VXC08906.1 conserved hypothetical protein [Flavobacterium sp. 9AF]
MKPFCAYILLFIQFLYAQDEGELLHAKMHKYDPNYRINYFDKMIFKIDINSDVDNYTIPNLSKPFGNESRFVPNQKTKLRFSFDYKFLGLFVSYSPNFYAKDESIYGETKTLDLSFKYFYTDRLRQEVDFKITKGFYVESPLQLEPLDIYPQLEIRTIGGKTFYILNNNFSYRAFENMTERQVKNAGSFIPSVGYYFNRLKSKRIDETEKSLIKVYSFDAIFQYGYMHNFILSRKWFATLGAHPGIGLNRSKSYLYEKNIDHETILKSTNMNFNLDLNLSLGYNNKNLFGGIKSNFRDYQYDNSKTAELINSKLYIDFFIGYRFKENKKIKKVFELLEKKIF